MITAFSHMGISRLLFRDELKIGTEDFGVLTMVCLDAGQITKPF
jgi:hypothetical protein